MPNTRGLTNPQFLQVAFQQGHHPFGDKRTSVEIVRQLVPLLVHRRLLVEEARARREARLLLEDGRNASGPAG